MRAGGINWAAVLVAAVAFYLIGFIIYGMLMPEQAAVVADGVSQAEAEAVATERMPFGAVMPLMTAIFMAVIFKWGRVAGAAAGVRWALVVALASAVPAMLYGWVYGAGPIETTLVDCGHLALGHVACGAILGGWR